MTRFLRLQLFLTLTLTLGTTGLPSGRAQDARSAAATESKPAAADRDFGDVKWGLPPLKKRFYSFNELRTTTAKMHIFVLAMETDLRTGAVAGEAARNAFEKAKTEYLWSYTYLATAREKLAQSLNDPKMTKDMPPEFIQTIKDAIKLSEDLNEGEKVVNASREPAEKIVPGL